jgi:hypothetical protein
VIGVARRNGIKQETLLRMQAAYDSAEVKACVASDLAAGRLDRAIQRALDDEKNGRVQPL